MADHVGLDGIGLSGFRSFGPDMQRLDDFSKVNLIVGKNNSGKSNILRFIERLGAVVADKRKSFVRDPLIDLFRGGSDEIRAELQIKKGSTYTGDLYTGFESAAPKIARNIPELAESFWSPFIFPKVGMVPDEAKLKEYWDPIARVYDPGDISRILGREFSLTGGTRDDQLEALARSLFSRHPTKMNARMVPGVRRVTSSSQEQGYPMDGAGLVSLLNTLRNPDLGSEEDLERFSSITRFVRDVLGEPEAELEISHKVDRLLVRMNGRRLPLSSLGSGIEQVIILASIVTYLRDTIVCIEEPETSLHPELQRKLLEYMRSETENQYFITTHSNAVFDSNGVSVYHCELVDNATQCRNVRTDRDKGHALDDLGYSASQILQANCVIWVEGPSDRILLNHWISSKDSRLREGLHYSIMFYGGRLLAHLTAADSEVEDFIRLTRINRHTAVVIDSDKESGASKINETKSRVIRETQETSSFVWVTGGREIENYIPYDTLVRSVRAVHGPNATLSPPGRFRKLTGYHLGDTRSARGIDKVKVARRVVESNPTVYSFDLDDRVDALVDFIRRANNLV